MEPDQQPPAVTPETLPVEVAQEPEGVEARQYKTLGVRLDNELHTRLSFISQLRDSTLQGEIVQAIRERVEAAQTDPELIEKAAEVRAQIEREAQARQAAIAGMFGSTALSSETERPARATGRRGTRNQTTDPSA
jgi:predicted transcriptional regulator